MKRLAIVALLGAVLLGCASSPPHTAEDTTRRFAVPLEEVYEAAKAACIDVGADFQEPVYVLEDDSAQITAASRTCVYGVLLLGYEGYTDVMLFMDDQSAQGVIKKSVYDEFWAAVEAHL
jgi:hypothetical protein